MNGSSWKTRKKIVIESWSKYFWQEIVRTSLAKNDRGDFDFLTNKNFSSLNYKLPLVLRLFTIFFNFLIFSAASTKCSKSKQTGVRSQHTLHQSEIVSQSKERLRESLTNQIRERFRFCSHKNSLSTKDIFGFSVTFQFHRESSFIVAIEERLLFQARIWI